ncbi:MAG: class II glutamine amidotransferase [Planctomycetaceae bacterium]
MCRFVLYVGPPITLDLLTTRPQYSIIRQSFKARLREEPLNGDGFGIAWYVPEISPEPALFRSMQPAWNNVNLLHLARVSRSPAILAHVRAATGGFGVTEANCHPFNADRFAFMHNGSVAEFSKLKRRLREGLSDKSYLWIHGTTDSEHLFALFRDHVSEHKDAAPLAAMAAAMQTTIADVNRMTRDAGTTRRSLLNMAVSDGRRAVVSRYATLGEPAPSLWLRSGMQFVCRDGECLMLDGEQASTVIVASEPLTAEPGWKEVPQNHLVLIDADHRVELRAVV